MTSVALFLTANSKAVIFLLQIVYNLSDFSFTTTLTFVSAPFSISNFAVFIELCIAAIIRAVLSFLSVSVTSAPFSIKIFAISLESYCAAIINAVFPCSSFASKLAPALINIFATSIELN